MNNPVVHRSIRTPNFRNPPSFFEKTYKINKKFNICRGKILNNIYQAIDNCETS